MTSAYTKIPDNQSTDQFLNFYQQPMQDFLRPQDQFFQQDFHSKVYYTAQNEMPSSTDSQESPDHPYNDDLSSYSGSHQSSKCSPEYGYPTESDKSGKNSKIPPIIRKGIHKYYEPIKDGNALFRYEENPNEYKKARKRIQNRESATRVRNRKKNYVEELEDEMNRIKAEQNTIQSKFVQVQQENNFLKQQLLFLQKKLGMQQQTPEPVYYQQPPVVQQPQPIQTHDYETSYPVHRNTTQMHMPNTNQPEYYQANPVNYEEPERFDFDFYRTLPRNLKTHTAFLAVFTAILCINFVSGAVGGIASGKNTHGSFIHIPEDEKVIIRTEGSDLKNNFHKPAIDWNTLVLKLINVFAGGISGLPNYAQYLFGLLYIGYAVYVIVMINWAYITKNSKKQ